MPTAFGRALKKRWLICRSWLTVATTAAAPATYANVRSLGRQAKPLGEAVVLPMTLLSLNPGSSGLFALVGERGVVFLKKGELEGVNRRAGWLILDWVQRAALYARVCVENASLEKSKALPVASHITWIWLDVAAGWQ